ncbi:MAG: aminotransferase class V-fold PLP-dependent enzyme, partial [Armatimonadetes bacterium]|nr:aminotransferase class V-fold PLP-dependent enzyme [Armatimonadota bacterium]
MPEELAINGGTPVRDRAARPWPTSSNASGHSFGEEELELLRQVIESGALGWQYGTMVKQFEQEFAARHGAEYSCAVTSGTAALHTAVAALRLEPGDEIITSAVTDMGTVIAIVQCNCVPVFADVDPQTMLMTPESVAERITDRTRAILAVHLWGQPCDMDALGKLCREHDLFLIEDCAQAHDAEWDGRRVGTIG